MTERLNQAGRTREFVAGASMQTALWLIVVLLAVNAAVLLLAPGPGSSAWAQPSPVGLARDDNSGVFVVPGQIGKDLWGAYLVDTRAGTIVLYQFNPNSQKLKLTAGRTFVFDRYLENYNTDPPPSEIAEVISKARRVQPAAPGTGSPAGGAEKPDANRSGG